MGDRPVKAGDGKSPEKYRPQRDFLTLLNVGDGTAIAQYGGACARAKWCWRLKDYIDTKFVDKYQDYRQRKWANTNEAATIRSDL